jgi:hypothetical protein
MKRCAQCNREIADSATTCGYCDSLGAIDLFLDSLPQQAPTVPDIPAPAPPPAIVAADLTDSVETARIGVPVHAAVGADPAEPVVVASAPPPLPPAPAAAASKPAVAANRRMMIAGLLVLAGGTLTFAMFKSSSAPATPITSAPAATKPGAPKPNASRPAAATAPSAPVSTPAAPPVSKWSNANRDWLLNTKKGAAFEVKSDNRVAIWQAVAQPVLVVRCDAGKMQMFVYTASAIQMEAQDENHTVGISVDGEPELTERWADSAEHDALFVPDSYAFAERLSNAQTLRVSYKPHNAPKAVATFQVAGLPETLQPAAKQCGIKQEGGRR